MIIMHIKYTEANIEPVPYHPSLDMKQFYRDTLERKPWLIEYFPDYDKDYLPSRELFWTIYKTNYPTEAKYYIDQAMKLKLGEDEENGDLIVVTEEFLDLIKGFSYKKCKFY